MTIVCKTHIKQMSKMAQYQLFIILWGSLTKRTPERRWNLRAFPSLIFQRYES